MSDSSAPPSPEIMHEYEHEHEFPRVRGARNQHQHQNQNGDALHRAAAATAAGPPSQYLPGGKKSLSGIAVRAFGLGIGLGGSLILTVGLAYWGYGLWRAPCFVATLALFHYLEFDMTARYNPPDASISSFLLLSNGVAYAAAHTAAMLELLIRYWLYSDYKPRWLTLPFRVTTLLPTVSSSWTVALGFLFIVVGQLVRSAAMRKASTNFNHVVQWTKRADHILVTDGVYAFSRHPSYFGFFWWGIGTQILLENRICFVAYAVVLWKFFHHRIIHEERHLVSFFGDDYLQYRKRTPVRMPFIR